MADGPRRNLQGPHRGRSTTTPNSSEEIRNLTVGEEAEERLDQFLARELEISRSRCVSLIEAGLVLVDGRKPKKSETLSGGQRIQVRLPPPAPLEVEPQDIPIEIVFQDSDLLVVNKQAGLVVHPAPGHRDGTLVNALLHHVKDLSGIGGKLRPGIVHRLDKDTSGLMVVAKGDDAHVALSNDLRKREVRRIYRAVAWGHLPESPMTIDAPVGRDSRDRKRMAVTAGGRRAVTRVRVTERWRAAEYLEVSLKTGRTHQIRVHLSYSGHPVVGDPVYGPGWERGMGGENRQWARELAKAAHRQLLHASDLVFRHPLSGEELRFHSPLPPDMAAIVDWCRKTSGSEGYQR